MFQNWSPAHIAHCNRLKIVQIIAHTCLGCISFCQSDLARTSSKQYRKRLEKKQDHLPRLQNALAEEKFLPIFWSV